MTTYQSSSISDYNASLKFISTSHSIHLTRSPEGCKSLYFLSFQAELKELNALRSEFKSQRPDIEFESEDDIEEGDDFQDHAEMITL